MFLFYLQLFIIIIFYLTGALALFMNCYYTCKIQQVREDSLHALRAVKHWTQLLCRFWALLTASGTCCLSQDSPSRPRSQHPIPREHQCCYKELGNRAPGLSSFYPGALGCQWWRIQALAAPQSPLGQITWCNWCYSTGTSDLKRLRFQLSVYRFHL